MKYRVRDAPRNLGDENIVDDLQRLNNWELLRSHCTLSARLPPILI